MAAASKPAAAAGAGASAAATGAAPKSGGGAFDPILRIGELESQLTKSLDRIKELEYLVAQLHDAKSASGSTAAAERLRAQLIEENVKLKAEVSQLGQSKVKHDKLLFSMGREHAAASQRLKNRASTSVTMKRLAYRAQEVKILQEEVVRWLNGLLHPGPALAAPLTTANLLEALSSGYVLCCLVKRLDPKYTGLGRVHEKAPAGSFFAHDNVKAFLSACTAWGVPAHALFDTNDLVATNTKNTRAVVHCLFALAKVVAVRFGIPPPDIVRIDMEIDELDKSGGATTPKASESAAQAAEREAARIKEESDVAKAIAELVKTYGVAAPTKLKGCLYQFASVSAAAAVSGGDAKQQKGAVTNAYVRMLRGTPLIRLNDGWEELSAYFVQLAQTHGVETPEEQALKKRVDEALAPHLAQLASVTAHRDALAAQVTELQQSQQAGSGTGGLVAVAEFDARVKAEVSKATADLREQLLRVMDEKDRAAANATELAQLRTALASAQAERDALHGQLLDAQARQLRSSSDAASVKTDAEQQLNSLKEQLLSAVRARDAAQTERTDAAGRAASLEAQLAALTKARTDDQTKYAAALAEQKTKADAAVAAAALASPQKTPGKKSVSVKTPGSAGSALGGGADGGVESDEDELPEDREKRKRREDEAAYKEFFYLTALAVKMNHNALGDAVELTATANANSTELFEKARAHDVPFHQFHKWIERELTMAYLLASHQHRAEFATVAHKGDLRSLRATRQTVIRNRPHGNPVIADSSQG